ncbi:MAG: sensor domain-containing phosphodiesterase [Halomonas sp.]|nr:sensor domain-containing phosphodiesterase [Halomonas sp.]MCC5901455.1 sensor domain-containing phosphodiesterase [Halomonas sp.]
MHRRNDAAETFRQLAEGLAHSGTPNFFAVQVEQLARLLCVDHVLVASVTELHMADTLAIWSNGSLQTNISYPLAGTPCETVVGREPCLYPCGVQARFPKDELLGQLGAESYMGLPLFDSSGVAIGLLAILHSQAMQFDGFENEILRIVAAQTGAELERRRDHRHMYRLAYTDGITGLPNRIRFIELLASMGEEAMQLGHPLSLLLLDIRRFKEINDLHGHFVGDQLLATVAGRLQLLAQHAVARLSGDEFALLLPKDDEEQLLATVKQLCDVIQQPIQLEHRVFNLDVSIGFACYPSHIPDASELFNAASIALHHAKKGENTNCFPYVLAMRQSMERRQWMTERLHRAILECRLELYFQPQVDLASHALTGAEALCRWHDPEWGWVSPGEFIPLAEERGLICMLGDWILAEAASQLITWQSRGTPLPGRLSINMSAQQFVDPQLTAHIAQLTAGVSPSAIALELTESDFMRDPDQAIIITQAMRQAGYALSIDDFGTGYSSLSYLRRFAADALKIDISFVREMLDNKNDRTIVQTIIAMAKALEMKTIAEGVETGEQARLLAEMGCNQAQGYWFGRPLPADAFATQWLAPTT